jgi:adenylate cyclase
MNGMWNHQSKNKFTLRFFILSIFILFTIILVIVLRTVTHDRFEKSMLSLAFNVMEQVSTRGFTLLMNRMRNMEIIDKASANLIKLNVVDRNNLEETADYATHLMTQHQGVFSAIESVYFADQNGNYIFSKKNDDETITTEIVNKQTMPPLHILMNFDNNGIFMNKNISNQVPFNAQNTTWFQLAKKIKEPTWLNVYHYQNNSFWGISVVTPVYNQNKDWVGALSVNIRLDYLRRLIETIKLSPHGSLFIVENTGKLITFPNLVQYNAKALQNIKNFPAHPEVQQSFLEYQKSGKNNFIFELNGNTYLAIYHSLYTFNGNQWFIGAVAPMTDFVGEALSVHFNTMVIAFSIFIIGLMILSFLITFVTKPLKEISREIEKIKDFKLDDSIPQETIIKEIQEIDDELIAMKKSLRSFQKYVPSTLVRQLIETGEVARLGGTKKTLAVLFSDIEKFTTIAEHMPPDLLTQQISQYFDELTKIILLENGTIDKYIGDAIMAFWGAPQAIENPCEYAAIAALLCLQCSNTLNLQWKKEGKPLFLTRMGIHIGDAIVGNLGSSERLNYTAIGDTINIANRLVSINKLYGTQIIVSRQAYEILKNHFIMRKIDLVILKGRVESNYIYELLGFDKKSLSFDIDHYTHVFDRAFQYYQQRKWDEAIGLFSECLKIYPEDTVAIVFMNRITQFKMNPPATSWNGEWNIIEK